MKGAAAAVSGTVAAIEHGFAERRGGAAKWRGYKPGKWP